MSYTVGLGDTIMDVACNSTGMASNVDPILTANGFTDWSPELYAGQVIEIPATLSTDINVLAQLNSYPICQNASDTGNELADELFDLLNGLWILSTGYWDVIAVWTPTGVWNPGN
jgi:hypothetical protein